MIFALSATPLFSPLLSPRQTNFPLNWRRKSLHFPHSLKIAIRTEPSPSNVLSVSGATLSIAFPTTAPPALFLMGLFLCLFTTYYCLHWIGCCSLPTDRLTVRPLWPGHRDRERYCVVVVVRPHFHCPHRAIVRLSRRQ